MAYAGKNVEFLLLSSRKSADIRLLPYLVLVVLLNFQFLSQVFFASQEKTSSAFPSVFILPCRTHPSLSPQKNPENHEKKPQIYARLDPPTTHTLLEPPRVFPQRRPRFEESSDFFFPNEKSKKSLAFPLKLSRGREERGIQRDSKVVLAGGAGWAGCWGEKKKKRVGKGK